MTRNPMVTRDTTSATEALQLMVQKHFRHLVQSSGCCPAIIADTVFGLFTAGLQRRGQRRRSPRHYQGLPRGFGEGRAEFYGL
jgi:hypothetical protein